MTPQTVPYVEQIGVLEPDGTVTAQPLVLSGNKVNGVVQDVVILVTNGVVPGGAVKGDPHESPPSIWVTDPTLSTVIFKVPLPNVPVCNTRQWCSGVRSTPVIDKKNNILYLVAGQTVSGLPEFELFAYDLNTMKPNPGATNFGYLARTKISGTCSSGEVFNASDQGALQQTQDGQLQQQQKPALLLDHNLLYIAFSSANREDENDGYNGWIFAYHTYAAGSTSLNPMSQPYCTSRVAPANPWGRGGFWQFGAGLAADRDGNVYGASGNGWIKDTSPDPQDDGQSYIKLAGGTAWTGVRAPHAAFHTSLGSNFLPSNEIESSSGTLVLPGPNGDRVLGMSKSGLFTVLKPDAMDTPDHPSFRAAWNLKIPILGDPDPLHREPGAIACNANSCNAQGEPDFNGTNACCIGGCTCTNVLDSACINNGQHGYSACLQQVHGSHPHIHGEPVYLPTADGRQGTVFWWGEKDSPRYLLWDVSLGNFPQLPTQTTNLVSADPSDEAPDDPHAWMMQGMPGGLMSLSANGTQNAVLWANVPQDNNDNNGFGFPNDAWLKAFDVSGALPKSHILQMDLGGSEYYGYPTIANGYVYVASHILSIDNNMDRVLVFSTRPPPTPVWSALPGKATAIGSGWSVGTNSVGGKGDFGVWQWHPGTMPSPGRWISRRAGARTISVDLNGIPWAVNSAGQILKWNGSTFAAFPMKGLTCAAAVASGSNDGETWATHCGDKTIWHWNISTAAWVQMGKTWAGNKVAVFSSIDTKCGDHLPVIQGTNNQFYFVAHGSCVTYTTSSTLWPKGGGPDLTTDFSVGTDGKIYRWDPTSGDWLLYSAAPFGVKTIVGAWSDGIYAASLDDNSIQKIHGKTMARMIMAP